MAPQCALIADIVGSRALSDRPSAQRALEAVLARAAQGLALLQEPVATIGDEFQLATRTLADALVYTARVQLLVPDGLSLRFGIGEGQILVLDALGADEHGHYLQDGSAWWAARAAIDRAHARQDGASPFQRTWYASDPEGAPADAVVNALLTLRDHAVWRLSARQRVRIEDTTGGVPGDLVGVPRLGAHQFGDRDAVGAQRTLQCGPDEPRCSRDDHSSRSHGPSSPGTGAVRAWLPVIVPPYRRPAIKAASASIHTGDSRGGH